MSMVELPGGGYATDSEALNALAAEARRRGVSYGHLVARTTEWERAGTIRDLRMQVDFTLQEAYTDGEGRRVRAIRYRADFTYRRKPRWPTQPMDPGEFADKMEWDWPLVVEDVKSRATKTKTYAMKRKLMKERFNIDIQEV